MSATDSLTQMMEGGGNIADLFATIDSFGAAIVKLTARDANDRPIRTVIAIDGIEECTEILNAIEAIEDAWADDRADD